MALLGGFTGADKNLYPFIVNTSFGKGEQLYYNIYFGIFSVGRAITKIDDKIFSMNSRPCYKVDGFGATSGWISWLDKVDDQWGAYIDTAALVTHVSYRKLKEGPFRKDELVTYDHVNSKAEVKLKNEETGLYDPPKYYKTPEHVRDIVGGFIYLRAIDLFKYNIGDTITVAGFFEDTAYKLKIVYGGTEKIRTKLGKILCHKLIPMVPDNRLFNGKNSVTAWLSADNNQIPIKVQAKMFIGSTGIELEEFRGLRNQLKVIR